MGKMKTLIGKILCKIGFHKYHFILGSEKSGNRCQRCGKNDLKENTFPIIFVNAPIISPSEKSTMKKSRIEFHAHSYMGITAMEYGKDHEDYPDEEPPNFFIGWDDDPKMFAKALREGAAFLDQYKNNHKITIDID